MTSLPLYVYFIVVSFLVSLTVYRDPKPEYDYLKWWPPFLFVTLLVELVAFYIYLESENNAFLYNFFVIVEFPFYLINLSFFIRNPRVKKIIRFIILPYALVSIINVLFIQGMMKFNTTTYSLGCLLVVTSAIYYFFELFRSPKAIKLKNDPAFWICTALLFFYCVTFPLYAYSNFWFGISKLFLKNFLSIVTILNVFLYTLFTIAFLCLKTRNYTLSPSSE